MTTLTCGELLAKLSEYLDDEVSPRIRQDLERHLSSCSVCEVLVDSTRKTMTIVADHRSYELPEDVSGRILARVRRALEDR